MAKPVFPFVEVQPVDSDSDALVKVYEDRGAVVKVTCVPTNVPPDEIVPVKTGDKILVERVHEYLVDNERVCLVHKADVLCVL